MGVVGKKIGISLLVILIGFLAYTSVMNRDYPVVLGTLYFFTIIGLVSRLLSDLCYVVVDPRISFERIQ